jgi:hypothetical protein
VRETEVFGNPKQYVIFGNCDRNHTDARYQRLAPHRSLGRERSDDPDDDEHRPSDLQAKRQIVNDGSDAIRRPTKLVMNAMRYVHTVPLAAAIWVTTLLVAVPLLSISLPQVELKRVPGGGIQPQVAADRYGAVHLVYFKGDPEAGDLYYSKSYDGLKFSEAIRVNSVPGTAVAVGNIRGARIALGRDGFVFVIWNGSRKTGDPVLGRNPMLFTRLVPGARAFEPERNLIHTAYGIDGGGGIAADRNGRLYAFWHAPIPGKKGEAFRRVWITRSEDDGHSFEPERVAWDNSTGACGCCSLNAYADSAGRVYVLFRSAEEIVNRDMYLLESIDHGVTFHGSDISKWKIGYCVMSSEAFAAGSSGVFAAWETEKQVHFGPVDPKTAAVTDIAVHPDSGTTQKYPVLAINRAGVLLASWTEGMGWKRGGSVHWQLFRNEGQPLGTPGAADGVPVWSTVAAYAKRNGRFVLLY